MNNDPVPPTETARPISGSALAAEVSHIAVLTSAAVVGVILFALAGPIHRADLNAGFDTLWRPSLAILSIMLSTTVAQRRGILEFVAARLAGFRSFRWDRGKPRPGGIAFFVILLTVP